MSVQYAAVIAICPSIRKVVDRAAVGARVFMPADYRCARALRVMMRKMRERGKERDKGRKELRPQSAKELEPPLLSYLHYSILTLSRQTNLSMNQMA